ncbi:DUF465 domain-containing protein [Erythrobacteraceae bacterium E2-1 Yellow Sea]|nr:DUF465 domain-containing protein [Erythrobacteraceae bacterium E2-1 Yellow Sea]
MSQHTPHELHDEFPDDGDLLHRLKMEDAHFQKLAEKYHEVNREIHRIESEVEAASDERAEDLKKQRLALVDEISGILARHRAPTG